MHLLLAHSPLLVHECPSTQSQSPMPLHVSMGAQAIGNVSFVYLGMFTQFPIEPPRLHALHAVSQALLQQTPSTQNPLVHWVPPVHVAPLACLFAHAFAMQTLPATQSPSPLQDVPQDVPRQL